jgi:hypothetical protein
MKNLVFIVILALVQICNLDARGNGFQIHDPLKFGITNPEQRSLIQASTLESSDIVKESKYDTAYIKTSAVCKMCKERIEHDMSFEKGVKAVELDLRSQVLTVVYKKGKTTKEDLKIAVTKIGYDADEMIADQKAHDRLPACCRKDVEPH